VRALLLLVAVASGCGRIGFDEQEPAGIGSEVSGSRLKLAWYEFGDSRVFAGFYDRLLDERCMATVWSGRRYCTPYSTFGSNVFLDAQCTQPGLLVAAPMCPEYPVFNFVVQSAGQCGIPPRLFRRGALVPQPTYYTSQGASCIATPVTNATLYEIGVEVDVPRELVEMTEVVGTGAARVQPLRFETSDGLRARSLYYDTELSMRCYPYMSGRAGVAPFCSPTTRPVASYFEDAACTIHKAVLDPACPAPPMLLRQDRCYDELFVAEPTTEQPLFAGATSCTAASEPNRLYLRVGPPAPVATFVEAAFRGDHRIVEHELTRDGMLYPLGFPYDRTLASQCTVVDDGAGGVICATGTAGVATLYRDAACTDAVQATTELVTPCAAAPARYARTGNCTVAPTFEVGAEITTPLYSNITGTCAVLTGFRSFAVGREVTGELAHGRFVVDR
jgi:hypothetical protein